MNCHDIEPLLLAERDGALTGAQQAALDQHAATCPACRQLRANLAEAMSSFRADAARVPVPDVDEAWRTLRAELHGASARPAKKRPLAPIIWFSAPLAAAAALAVVYLGLQPSAKDPAAPAVAMAQVEPGDPSDARAATIAYVDQESGWLVVWADDSDAATSG